jgi:hypothetical protein
MIWTLTGRHARSDDPWWTITSHWQEIRGVNPVKMLAMGLIVAGGLGLAYGSFTYTKETHDATLGPINISVSDRETVNIPVWAGVVAIAVGGGLLFFAGRKS